MLFMVVRPQLKLLKIGTGTEEVSKYVVIRLDCCFLIQHSKMIILDRNIRDVSPGIDVTIAAILKLRVHHICILMERLVCGVGARVAMN